MSIHLSQKTVDVLYSAACCLCSKSEPGQYISLESKSHSFRIYPYKVTVVSNCKRNERLCLLIFRCIGHCLTEDLRVKFENGKDHLSYMYSTGNLKKSQIFVENEDWKWFMKNLSLKTVEMV